MWIKLYCSAFLKYFEIKTDTVRNLLSRIFDLLQYYDSNLLIATAENVKHPLNK